jgi:uncharacterized phage protein (TIGR02216 family)
VSGALRWSAALALAARLGTSPEAFWRLSIVEWRALLGVETAAPLSRRELDTLMRDHPDR